MSDEAGGVAFDPGAMDAAERRFWRDLRATAVPDALTEHGVVLRCFGPVQASLVVGLPAERRVNLVLGASEAGAVGEGHLAAALEWIEAFGVDYHVPVTPGLSETDAARELLAERGYRPEGGCVRYVRDGSPPGLPEPADIETIKLENDLQQETFSAMLAEEAELEPWAGTFFFELALRAVWRCYMALVDEAPAAVAAMLIHGGVAELCLTATRPLAREIPCQEALMRRRIADASAAGCRTLFLETGASLAAHPDELRPLIARAGFEQAFERPNWRRR